MANRKYKEKQVEKYKTKASLAAGIPIVPTYTLWCVYIYNMYIKNRTGPTGAFC